MSRVKSDLVNFDKLIENFDLCTQSYVKSIDEFINTIEVTKGWAGTAADVYYTRFSGDKHKYTDFGEELVKFKETLEDTSSELKTCINSSLREG